MQIKMKFFLDFVTCYGSCSSEVRQPPGEETRMLIVQEHRRRRVGRKRGRVKNRHEWQPCLSSISEDNVMTAERTKSIETPVAAGWRRSLKRKISSMSERDRNRSLDLDHARETPLSAMIPGFPPTPFMF